MTNYLAYYKSPTAADVRSVGSFEFESKERMGTKAIRHDARLKMLSLYGSAAASWTIERIEKITSKNKSMDGQLAFDFRPEKKRRRRRTKQYW